MLRIAAGLAFVGAHIYDFFITIRSIQTKAEELNPIARGYMEHFGIRTGLAMYKVSIVALILISSILIYIGLRGRNGRPWEAYMLFAGAAVTFILGSLWLL